MRFVKDPEPAIFEDRLHYMMMYDPRPEGTPYNDYDPFAPYYFCPDGLGFNMVYQDIVELLKDLTTAEVTELRQWIIDCTDDAKAQYRSYIAEALPNRVSEEYEDAAKYMREMRKYELLKMFPPVNSTLSTGTPFTETQLWAVYALEEFQSAVELATTPPFANDKESMAKSHYIEDMLELELPAMVTKKSPLERAKRAVRRQRSMLMDAGLKLIFATKHIQYALALTYSNRIQQERAERLAIKDSRMKGLKEINKLKDQAVEKALALAAANWQDDLSQSIRIGEMADIVYRSLAEQGLNVALPDTSDRLKAWIKPVAPDYARRGGRSRKTSQA